MILKETKLKWRIEFHITYLDTLEEKFHIKIVPYKAMQKGFNKKQ